MKLQCVLVFLYILHILCYIYVVWSQFALVSQFW